MTAPRPSTGSNHAPAVAAAPDPALPTAGDAPVHISYGFARRHGVLVESAGEAQVTVIHKPGVAVAVLGELRRVSERPLQLREMDADEFSESGDALHLRFAVLQEKLDLLTQRYDLQ